MMTFVIRNDQFGSTIYLAGSADLPIGDGLVISPIIFNAQAFETEDEAQDIVRDLPGIWTISEISEAGMSANLRRTG